MKSVKTKKIISLLLALTFVMTTFVIAPLTANAAVAEQNVGKLSLWADPQGTSNLSPSEVMVASDNGSTTVISLGLVQAHTIDSGSSDSSSSSYYLFLPSNTDMNNVKLYFNSSYTTAKIVTPPANITKEVTNGATTDIFKDYGTSYTYNDVWTLIVNNVNYKFYVVKSSEVATMYINTASGSMSYINSADKDSKTSETGSIMVVEPDGTVDYNGVLSKISGHGNGSWDDFKMKLSYNIKLASSADLVGMGKAKKWILLSGATDSGCSSSGSAETTDTQLKNRITYDFADYIGINYQPELKPVDLYCEGHYMGSYELVQKPEIKSNRINVTDAYENLEIANGTTDATTGLITPADFSDSSAFPNLKTIAKNSSNITQTSTIALSAQTFGCENGGRIYTVLNSSEDNLNDPDDVTGGYIYGIEVSDRWIKETAGLCGYSRQGWTVRSCDYINRHMIDYSYKLLYAMGSSVYQSNGNVPSSSTTTGSKANILYNYTTSNSAPDTQYQGMHWSDLLDANCAVTYYWTQEFFKNMDASTTSTYFYKDSDSVDSMIYAGPVWDSDNAICSSGSRYGYDFGGTSGWYVKNQKIYKFKGSTNTSGNASDASPYSFYAALSRQSDFWAMAEDMWYDTISPAADILLGKADASGRLHSIDWYVNEIKDSATMNNVRFGGSSSTYESATVNTYLTDWVSGRQTWVKSQISTESISSATSTSISNQSFTGSEIKPTFTLTYNNSTLGAQTLEEGTDYSVAYSNNTAVGTATITITGLSRFVGSTKTMTFKIIKNDISNGTFTIFDGAYIGDEITPTVLDSNSNEIVSGINYTWYVDSVSQGTSPTYTVKDADAGKTITANATGDNTSVIGTLTSNSCPVASTSRPTGLLKNIATFSYKYGDDGTSLQGGKNIGYSASSGVQKDTAKLRASVNGSTYDSITWSGSDTFTRTDGTTGQQPIMEPSSNNPWVEYPYFDISFSTTGYTDVTFTADIGATKKGSKYYALMYSTDGTTFNYVNNADNSDYLWYEFSEIEGKTMKTAFDVTLPTACENQENIIVRIIVDENYTLDGADTLFTTTKTSGKIAINNVIVNGTSENDITALDAPTITTAEGALFNDDLVNIEDNNSGATLYYTLTDSKGVVSSPYTYSKGFAPFDLVSGNTVTVSAWSESGIYKSDEVSKTYSSAGDAIARFNLANYSEDITNGALPASSGTYGQSTLMKAIADGTTQYVPIYNTEKKALAISPDDGLKWSENSGFYFELATAGYDNITFSCDAYTTTQGPNSMSLQYSTDNKNWATVVNNKQLTATGTLQSYMDKVTISGIGNSKKVYIRLATTENLTSGGETLFANASKGNVYINNVIIGGTDIDNVLKMPYTNKATNYFGLTKTIKYYSADNDPMQYTVTNSDGKIVLSGAYPSSGILISSASSFTSKEHMAYTVNVWAGDDDDQSAVNSSVYYYKGDTISAFEINSTNFSTNVATDNLSISATSGTGALSMYPNGTDSATLSYSSSYGVKVSATATNSWVSSYNLDNPTGNGYWLIKTSTLGATDLTMTLEQVSSSKGPRDFGIAYSTDGTTYTYLSNSNSRTIETGSPVETYSNISLPSALDNKENVYIKVFINGGENLAGYELADATNSLGKGNTGIDNIVISGITEPVAVTATVKTTVLENKTAGTGTVALSGINVYVDNELIGTTNEQGEVTFTAVEGKSYSITLDNTTFSRTVTMRAGGTDTSINIPMVALDITKDGYINARDYVLYTSMDNETLKSLYTSIYIQFVNTNTKTFQYGELV